MRGLRVALGIKGKEGLFPIQRDVERVKEGWGTIKAF